MTKTLRTDMKLQEQALHKFASKMSPSVLFQKPVRLIVCPPCLHLGRTASTTIPFRTDSFFTSNLAEWRSCGEMSLRLATRNIQSTRQRATSSTSIPDTRLCVGIVLKVRRLSPGSSGPGCASLGTRNVKDCKKHLIPGLLA